MLNTQNTDAALSQKKMGPEEQRLGLEDTVACVVGQIDILEALDRDEDGDANLFKAVHRDRLVFDHAQKQWYEWQGHFWQADTIGQASAAVSDVIDLYVQEALRQQKLSGDRFIKDHHKATADKLIKKAKKLPSIFRLPSLFACFPEMYPPPILFHVSILVITRKTGLEAFPSKNLHVLFLMAT